MGEALLLAEVSRRAFADCPVGSGSLALGRDAYNALNRSQLALIFAS